LAGVLFKAVSRIENRVFFPQAALDQWIVDGTVDIGEGELTILGEGRRYKLAEAVRVLREVGGAGDVHGLVGRAKVRTQLQDLGAEIVETSMLIGDAAYDVEPGWVGVPVGPFREHMVSEGRRRAREGAAGRGGPDPTSDEDLLARLVPKNV
jgi:hypothetical protein